MIKNAKAVNLSLQIVPIDCSNSYEIIDAAIEAIKESGIKHEVQPFATIMEGKLEELLKVVNNAKNAATKKGANEMLMNIQIHLNNNADVSFESKTEKFKTS